MYMQKFTIYILGCCSCPKNRRKNNPTILFNILNEGIDLKSLL